VSSMFGLRAVAARARGVEVLAGSRRRKLHMNFSDTT
jgi:hypothetical protein